MPVPQLRSTHENHLQPLHKPNSFIFLLGLSYTYFKIISFSSKMETHMNVASSPTSPTTFVQADANTFRDLVQKLTGLVDSDSEKLPITLPGRLSSKLSHPVDPMSPRRSPFKLQERRHAMRKLEIKLGLTSLRNSPSHLSPGQTHHRL